ncbi:MAG: aspartate dehydrogenase [Lachnospiraceae bacterium]|nr:aspartate dehydrogenase [Lachnospiraceae bacterium]
MSIFKHKKGKDVEAFSYDRENMRPVIKCSICNGEQVAGFKDIHTGQFEEVMLIKGDKDLEEFKKKYGVEAVSREY